MTPSRKRFALTAALLLAGAAAIGIPAFGQEAPESLLPPGFGEPAPPPPPAQPAPTAPAPARPAPPVAPAPTLDPLATLLSEAIAPEEEEAEEPLEPLELPDWARRSMDYVGAFDGYGPTAFGAADGRFLSILMRRLDTPIASRWAEIMLRRALLTRVPTPRRVQPADWVAERANLLLRLGEADGARMLVQGVDVDRFSPRLRVVAIRAALATADPAGLCPLSDGGETVGDRPVWPLIRAMCAALSGETAVASTLIGRAARTGGGRREIDHLLAEKVVGAGSNSRRAVQLEWDPVDRLTDWRFGLASAVGVPVPDRLMAGAGPHFQAWRARAPMLPLAARLEAARIAAALGVFSSAALVDIYGAQMDETGEFDTQSPAGRLRQAYVGDDQAIRMTALRSLWDEAANGAGGERDRYAASILTARAAARITPDAALEEDAPALIASMLSAGLDWQAERWARIVDRADGTTGDRAWALLATGATRPVVDLSGGRVDRFARRAGEEGPYRTQMLIAALGGLGRLSNADLTRLAEEHGVPIGRRTIWTRALDQAVSRGQPATVALLAAVAMQTPRWQGVPPGDFYRLIGALRHVGLEGEARMIAAEAMARL
ncbi:hypothetical protein CLG96_09470 [Sphingomonas oleivorans]|uniref:Antifreeze glycopeptide polyprotein n=1 Tax=Sphingomonas oleivorans TaxID=1735121 RepID=A0A2T5FYS4_9SPHN|nr:hypothetical protein [Sphingomonas oleivorans]PTQ11634.1 hypothetical protein CLG96_09470 [Sphingomonas oleivorans]